MPATEEARRRIQQKLSMQRSLGGNQKLEDFFGKRKEVFLQKMVEMGMDLIEVTDFLDEKCIHEENAELIIDNLMNPQYINPLKMNFVQAPNPLAGVQQHGYGYMPDVQMHMAAQQQQKPMHT